MENNYITKSKFEKIGLSVISWSIGLSIIFFLPFLAFDIVFAKGMLLTFGAFLGIIFYILDCIVMGRLLLPKGYLNIVFIGIIAISVITTFFVPNQINSFIGTGFDFGTVSTLIVAFIYFFLFSIWGKGVNFVKHITKTFFIVSSIAIVFTLIDIIFGLNNLIPKALLGIGNHNLIGSFNDFGIFLGAFVIINSIVIENYYLNKKSRILAILIFILSLGLLFIINYAFIWKLIGLFGLSMLIYRLMPKIVNNQELNIKKRGFSIIGFILIICSFIAIIGSASIANLTSQKPLYFINNESRPTLKSTVTVITHTYKAHPLVGAGLNRFNLAWESNKSFVLNGKFVSTPYWSKTFNHGFGIFFTLITTLGILAGILFIYFMVLVCKKIMSLFSQKLINNSNGKHLFIYSALSLYTMVIFVFDTPNTAIFIMIFAFWGILISYVDNLNEYKNKVFSFINDPRYSFFSILSLLIFLILTLLGGYIMTRAFYANYLVNKASLMNADLAGIEKGERYVKKAFEISGLDSYARALSNVQVLKIVSLVNNKEKPEEELRSLFAETINNSAINAKLAVSIDPDNYQNYLSILRVQEVLLSLGNKDVYNDAIIVSNKALSLSPNNLNIIMRQANIAVSVGNYNDANMFIDKVIAINPYYTDAYILRSQIYVTNGDVISAYNIIDQGIVLNPKSGALMYQKGLILMSQNNYSLAAEAFESAKRFSPNVTAIHNSLAEAYEKLGNYELDQVKEKDKNE